MSQRNGLFMMLHKTIFIRRGSYVSQISISTDDTVNGTEAAIMTSVYLKRGDIPSSGDHDERLDLDSDHHSDFFFIIDEYVAVACQPRCHCDIWTCILDMRHRHVGFCVVCRCITC